MIKAATAAATLLLLLISCAYSQQPPTVTIQAHQQTQPDGRVRYEYRVINKSRKRIVGFAIGSNYYLGISELTVPPRGWTFDTGLAKGSSTSPRAWHATVIVTEESPYIEIEWRNNGGPDILPGQTIGGFSVITPKPDPHYLNGHWTVFFSNSTVESATLSPEL